MCSRCLSCESCTVCLDRFDLDFDRGYVRISTRTPATPTQDHTFGRPFVPVSLRLPALAIGCAVEPDRPLTAGVPNRCVCKQFQVHGGISASYTIRSCASRNKHTATRSSLAGKTCVRETFVQTSTHTHTYILKKHHTKICLIKVISLNWCRACCDRTFHQFYVKRDRDRFVRVLRPKCVCSSRPSDKHTHTHLLHTLRISEDYQIGYI